MSNVTSTATCCELDAGDVCNVAPAASFSAEDVGPCGGSVLSAGESPPVGSSTGVDDGVGSAPTSGSGCGSTAGPDGGSEAWTREAAEEVVATADFVPLPPIDATTATATPTSKRTSKHRMMQPIAQSLFERGRRAFVPDRRVWSSLTPGSVRSRRLLESAVGLGGQVMGGVLNAALGA